MAQDGKTPQKAHVAFIAGGSRGLGLLVAQYLGRAGLSVALSARDETGLHAAVEGLRAEGLTAQSYVADVSDPAALSDAVAAAENDLGPIDVAIHVAGVIQVGPLDAVTPELFDQAIGVMLKGPINLSFAVLPGMRKRGFGRFATVTSIGGVISVPHLLPYSTAKFGAVGFTEGLAAELAGTGVTATTVIPGLMRTGSHVQAQFVGDVSAEYAWFGPSASLPGISMDADCAAKQIVDGVLAGRPLVVLSSLAKVSMRVAGLMPATITRAMGVVARVLPKAKGNSGNITDGHTAREGLTPRTRKVIDALTTLGDRASRRNNETRRN